MGFNDLGQADGERERGNMWAVDAVGNAYGLWGARVTPKSDAWCLRTVDAQNSCQALGA